MGIRQKIFLGLVGTGVFYPKGLKWASYREYLKSNACIKALLLLVCGLIWIPLSQTPRPIPLKLPIR
jgi:hypothetical protein